MISGIFLEGKMGNKSAEDRNFRHKKAPVNGAFRFTLR